MFCLFTILSERLSNFVAVKIIYCEVLNFLVLRISLGLFYSNPLP